MVQMYRGVSKSWELEVVKPGISWTKLSPVDGPMYSKVTRYKCRHHVILFNLCDILLKKGAIA